jgi:hypothetical protein
MTPQHHEERLRMWAVRTGKPVLAIDYGKAPEYPYPFATDEAFDCYRVLVESVGTCIGMSGRRLGVIMTGDSAGATILVNLLNKVIETQHQHGLPVPRALVLNYPALDFNFTSWMSPAHMKVLRAEQSSANIAGLAAQKDHYTHISPLSMVGERRAPLRRRRSWKDALKGPFAEGTAPVKPHRPRSQTSTSGTEMVAHVDDEDGGAMADAEGEGLGALLSGKKGQEKTVLGRVQADPMSQSTLERKQVEFHSQALANKDSDRAAIGTRVTMTVSAACMTLSLSSAC